MYKYRHGGSERVDWSVDHRVPRKLHVRPAGVEFASPDTRDPTLFQLSMGRPLPAFCLIRRHTAPQETIEVGIRVVESTQTDMRKPVVTGQCRPQAEPKSHVPAPCMRSKQLGYGFDLLAQYSEPARGRDSRKQ